MGTTHCPTPSDPLDKNCVSGVAAAGNIGRLERCSSSAGELGDISSWLSRKRTRLIMEPSTSREATNWTHTQHANLRKHGAPAHAVEDASRCLPNPSGSLLHTAASPSYASSPPSSRRSPARPPRCWSVPSSRPPLLRRALEPAGRRGHGARRPRPRHGRTAHGGLGRCGGGGRGREGAGHGAGRTARRRRRGGAVA